MVSTEEENQARLPEKGAVRRCWSYWLNSAEAEQVWSARRVPHLSMVPLGDNGWEQHPLINLLIKYLLALDRKYAVWGIFNGNPESVCLSKGSKICLFSEQGRFKFILVEKQNIKCIPSLESRRVSLRKILGGTSYSNYGLIYIHITQMTTSVRSI